MPRLEATKPHGPALSSMVTCRETSAGARDESPDERIHGSEPRGLRAKGTLVNHLLRLPFRPQSLALATTSRPRLSAFLNLTERAPVRAANRGAGTSLSSRATEETRSKLDRLREGIDNGGWLRHLLPRVCRGASP